VRAETTKNRRERVVPYHGQPLMPRTTPRTTPRGISALIGPDPRVIADDGWAKLLWAGLTSSTATSTTAVAQILPGPPS
jgi:hypothetical protein